MTQVAVADVETILQQNLNRLEAQRNATLSEIQKLEQTLQLQKGLLINLDGQKAALNGLAGQLSESAKIIDIEPHTTVPVKKVAKPKESAEQKAARNAKARERRAEKKAAKNAPLESSQSAN
jgi:hypothetical protein